MSRRCLGTLAVAGCLVMPVEALAGTPCDDPKPPSVDSIRQAMDMAHKTLNALDQSGAQVVVLARAGQDLTRYGLTYSHLGFAYRANSAEGVPVWRVLHKLNDCGTAVSGVYLQGLGDFFLGNLWSYEAAFVVPTPEVQERLQSVFADRSRVLSMHHEPYSMVSYAWSVKYQQSNQWAIETLAAAMEPGVTSRERAQAWLRFKGYEPSTLQIGALTRLGGRITRANIAFDDHPNEKRFSNRVDTVTVDSVFAWMPRAGLSAQPVELRP